MTRPGIEHGSPGPLANTLLIRPLEIIINIKKNYLCKCLLSSVSCPSQCETISFIGSLTDERTKIKKRKAKERNESCLVFLLVCLKS